MATPKGRSWYFGRLWKAILLGTVLLIFFMLIFAVVLWQAYAYVVTILPYVWMEGLVIAGGAVLFGLVGYLSAGPLALIVMGVYLSVNGDWEKLRNSLPEKEIEIPPYEDSSSIFQSVMNAIGLSTLVFFSAVVSLIPFLAFVAFFVAPFALGKDWCWTADEQFNKGQRKRSRFLYCVGMGVLPAIIATIPIFGVVSIPFLQVAGMMRYAKKEEHVSP